MEQFHDTRCNKKDTVEQFVTTSTTKIKIRWNHSHQLVEQKTKRNGTIHDI